MIQCPVCLEDDEGPLVEFEGEEMCSLCAEHFENARAQYENELRESLKYYGESE